MIAQNHALDRALGSACALLNRLGMKHHAAPAAESTAPAASELEVQPLAAIEPTTLAGVSGGYESKAEQDYQTWYLTNGPGAPRS